MPGFVKKGGVWEGLKLPLAKQGGLWVPTKEGLVKAGGVWEKWFTSAPAAAPAQVTDLQITAYSIAASIPTMTLGWTPPAGVQDYILDVFVQNSTNQPGLFWKGATVNNDGTGGERDYVPTRSLVITPSPDGEYVYTHNAAVGGTNVLLFRLTPRNAVGSAPWPSNCPWVMCQAATNVALPTPLQASAIVFSGTALNTGVAVSWTAPTINVGAWTQTRVVCTAPRFGNFTAGSGQEGMVASSVAQPNTSIALAGLSFPYGVFALGFSYRSAGGIHTSGSCSMIPGYGIRRVPYVSSGMPGASPFTVVAAINTYDVGTFKDVGFTLAGKGGNPVDIGSVTPGAYNMRAIHAIIRGGQATCAFWRSTPAASTDIVTMGYGDENELARYLRGTNADFVADTGAGTATWTWSAATIPDWGLSSGQTYNFYIN